MTENLNAIARKEKIEDILSYIDSYDIVEAADLIAKISTEDKLKCFERIVNTRQEAQDMKDIANMYIAEYFLLLSIKKDIDNDDNKS